MNIIGNWKGYYAYGEGYLLPQFGQRVNFSVKLEGTNEKFIGTAKEEPSDYSVPLEATIQGFSENDFISFIKSYPKRPVFKEVGSKELLFENGQLDIEHVGYIDPNFNSIYGTWAITELESDEQGTYEVRMYGTWLLRKVE